MSRPETNEIPLVEALDFWDNEPFCQPYALMGQTNKIIDSRSGLDNFLNLITRTAQRAEEGSSVKFPGLQSGSARSVSLFLLETALRDPGF
jgi:hypothetical protein